MGSDVGASDLIFVAIESTRQIANNGQYQGFNRG